MAEVVEAAVLLAMAAVLKTQAAVAALAVVVAVTEVESEELTPAIPWLSIAGPRECGPNDQHVP